MHLFLETSMTKGKKTGSRHPTCLPLQIIVVECLDLPHYVKLKKHQQEQPIGFTRWLVNLVLPNLCIPSQQGNAITFRFQSKHVRPHACSPHSWLGHCQYTIMQDLIQTASLVVTPVVMHNGVEAQTGSLASPSNVCTLSMEKEVGLDGLKK